MVVADLEVQELIMVRARCRGDQGEVCGVHVQHPRCLGETNDKRRVECVRQLQEQRRQQRR